MQNKGSNETILSSKTGIEDTAERRNSNRGDTSPHIKKTNLGHISHQKYCVQSLFKKAAEKSVVCLGGYSLSLY